MLEHASNLEFEEAAKIRDDIKNLENNGILINKKIDNQGQQAVYWN